MYRQQCIQLGESPKGSSRNRTHSCSSSQSVEAMNIELALSNASSFDNPLSPSTSRTPSVVRQSNSINSAVTSAMQTVTQLHVLLDQFESHWPEEDGMSMSDDGMLREETCLREVEAMMRQEIECVDRLVLQPEFDTTVLEKETPREETACLSGRLSQHSIENATVCTPMIAYPNKLTYQEEQLMYGSSPTGVADLLDPTPLDKTKVTSKETTLLERFECRAPPQIVQTLFEPTSSSQGHKKEGTSPRSLMSDVTDYETNNDEELPSELSAAAAETRSFQSTMQQAAQPIAAAESLIATFAWLAFGQQHRDGTNFIPTKTMAEKERDRPRMQSFDGGVCAASSAAAIAASVLCGSRMLTDGQFLTTMVVLTPLAAMLEVKLPHHFEEPSIALGILLCGFALERTVFA